MNRILYKILHYMNHVKMFNKLMFIYIVGGLIPLLLVSAILSNNTKNVLLDQAINEAQNNSERLEERLSETINILADVSDGLYLDKQLEDIIKTEYSSSMGVIKDLNEFTKIDDYLRLYQEINSIRVYVNNPTLLDDSQVIKLKGEDINSDWYQLAKVNEGKMAFIVKEDEINRKSYLSLVRMLKRDGKNMGVLVVNMSHKYLGKMIDSESYDVILSVDKSQIVLASEPSLVYKDVDEVDEFKELVELPTGIHDIQYQGENYKAIFKNFETSSIRNTYQLVNLIPISDINSGATNSVMTSGVLILLSSVLSFLLVISMSKAISDRINLFRKDMHKVAQGDFGVRSQLAGLDEIGELSLDLNLMVESIQTLIHEVYEVRLQKEQLGTRQREAQFKMLASQINPHFLYNSLETIRMKALISGEKDIAVVVKKLAKIMRRNLSISNDEVLLENEIELISNYLEIQQFRFGDKVSFSLNVNCDIDNYYILPLLLQPLVENAFIHGLERKIEPGHISIHIDREEEYLVIKVTDDGLGVEPERLDKILGKLGSDAQNIDGSIGLINVNQRIKLYYGNEYRLSIQSHVGKGTDVIIYLPGKKGGNSHV